MIKSPGLLLPLPDEHDVYVEPQAELAAENNIEVNEHVPGDNLIVQTDNSVPESQWRSVGGVIVRPHTYEAPTYDDPSEKAWSLSEQEREMIYYGVVAMKNDPTEVGVCFNIGPEVVLKVIEIESERLASAPA
jgi:hypothetical protein